MNTKATELWRVDVAELGVRYASVTVRRGDERRWYREVGIPTWWQRFRGLTFSRLLTAVIAKAQSIAIDRNTEVSEVWAVVEAIREVEKYQPNSVVSPLLSLSDEHSQTEEVSEAGTSPSWSEFAIHRFRDRSGRLMEQRLPVRKVHPSVVEGVTTK